jgi:hypothetical protein
MMRRRLTILLFCLTGSCLLVFGLYRVSIWKSRHPNGFLRKLPSHQLKGLGFLKITGSSWYLAGTDTNKVYLGNWDNPKQLMAANLQNRTTSLGEIKTWDTLTYFKGAYIRSDAGHFYFMDGAKPVILKGNMTNLTLTEIQKTMHFTAAVPLSSNSFIIRAVSRAKQNVILKLTNGKVTAKYLPEQQGDGLFSTDGSLIKTEDNARLFYSFYYHNEFVCLDTNLNLIYKGRTIDTVSHAKLKLGRINSLHETTLAAPPQFVNEQCAANDRYLFVHSALKADNEIDETLSEASPVDVYRIKGGKYLFSFYIANFNKEKMLDFTVRDHELIALYGHYLYFYQLNF